jgi:hypothetical protein
MYRKSIIVLLAPLVLFAALLIAPKSQAGVEIGLSADEDGIRSFHLAIGEHYGVKEKEVIVVRDQKIPDEDLPVVFFLSKHARVTPDVIVRLRLSGNTWMQIATQFDLGPDLFYVQFDKDPGPPYGKAWGRFKKHKRSDWHKVRLVDADIINLVNLKFAVAYYGCSPYDVVKMRGKGNGFAKFHKQRRADKMNKRKHKAKAVASIENQKQKAKSTKAKKKKK